MYAYISLYCLKSNDAFKWITDIKCWWISSKATVRTLSSNLQIWPLFLLWLLLMDDGKVGKKSRLLNYSCFFKLGWRGLTYTLYWGGWILLITKFDFPTSIIDLKLHTVTMKYLK